MAGTTSAFGWDYPTSTDYVKDGATAIQTLADDIDASLKRHGCVITRTTNQAIATLTSTSVLMTTELLDTDNYHSTVTNTNRITVPAGLAGVYTVFSYARWDDVNTVVNPLCGIALNGNMVVRTQQFTNNLYVSINLSWTGYMAVGDWVELRVYHETGVNRNVNAVNTATNLDPRSPVLGAFRVGGPA